MRDILESDSELAFDWLLSRIREGMQLYELEDYDLNGAIPKLSGDQRFALLVEIALSKAFVPDDSIRRLIGDDIVLYRRLLAEHGAKRLHLRALIGRPNPAWGQMASAALDAGYAVKAVHDAAEGGLQWRKGEDSTYWDSWRVQWESLLESDDPKVQEIGRLGIERCTLLRDQSRKMEEDERVYAR